MTQRDVVFPSGRQALYERNRYSPAIKSNGFLFVSGQVGSNEDGSHEHHLKVAKRQEKLSDMFQSLMLGKKKDGNHEEQPLSLMANWVACSLRALRGSYRQRSCWTRRSRR